MSKIMRRFFGTARNPREWSPDIDRARDEDARIDIQADLEMSRQVQESREPVVVDAWLQPWLYEGDDALRVWLSSSFSSRLKKAQVSYLRDGLQPPPDAADQLRRKDEFSVKRFRSLYGLDFSPESGPFDIVIDNSSYIAEASVEHSDIGIALFDAALWDRIRTLM